MNIVHNKISFLRKSKNFQNNLRIFLILHKNLEFLRKNLFHSIGPWTSETVADFGEFGHKFLDEEIFCCSINFPPVSSDVFSPFKRLFSYVFRQKS